MRKFVSVKLFFVAILFSLESNAFEGISNAFDGAVDVGVEFKLAFPPLGSVERNSVDSYWQGSRENEISKGDYELYVREKMEDLQKGDPQAIQVLRKCSCTGIRGEY